MSNQNPYDQLGVTDASSFEEIQDARNRLFEQHQGDHKQLDSIEAAYDAVLMDRLRMRQEGKIKVPDRIRFPEKLVPPAPTPSTAPVKRGPEWLQSFIDTPTRADILLPAGILTALSALVLAVRTVDILQISLILGVGSSFYFLYRKERKLGRAVLLGLLGLILGFVVGGLLSTLLQTSLIGMGLKPEVVATVITFFILWLISGFLR